LNLALKMLRNALWIPALLAEKIDTRYKKEKCVVGVGVCLYPESRIWNLQNRRKAIEVGKQSHIRGQLVVLGHGGIIQIGERCFVGEESRIWSASSIAIGNRVLVSHGVNIHDNDSHSLSAASRYLHFTQILLTGHPAVLDDVCSAPIVIEDDVWIGFNATILKGVTIGKGAIVGAASVVTKDVESYTIVAGNPARVIGSARP